MSGCAIPKACRCDCGYRCGGPGRCTLPMMECLGATDGKHFVRDCGHDFTGHWVELPYGGSVTCKHCGLTAEAHDCAVGP